MSGDAGATGRSVRFANVVCATMAVIAAAGLYYSWNKSSMLADRGVLVGYASASSVALVLFAASFWLRASWRINLAVVTFSVLLGVYAVEAVLWLKRDTTYHADAARAAGAEFDARTKLQVIEELRSRDVDAWPSTMPNKHAGRAGLPARGERLYPLAGRSRSTTVMCNESGEFAIYDSDEHGFNNPLGSHAPEPLDIAIIGDSFAQGACVGLGKDVAGVLRGVGFRVLNVGMEGNSALLELATLTEYVLPLRPRAVLWLYFEGNDILDLPAELADPLLSRYLQAGFSQRLRDRQDELDETLTAYIDSQWEQQRGRHTSVALPWEHFIKLRRLRTLLGLRSVKTIAPPVELGHILAEAKSRVAQAGGTMYFVYLPAWFRYKAQMQGEYLARDEVLDIVTDLGIAVIDFHDAMRAHGDPLALYPFRVRGHYNEAGYALLARTVATRLERDGVAPGPPSAAHSLP